MLKKLTILTATLGLFTACGGESPAGSFEQMRAKDGIIIFYHYPEKTCHSQEFYQTMQHNSGFKEILIQTGTNSLRCADYNKAYPTCVEVDAEKHSFISCVVGFNSDRTDNPNNKPSEETVRYKIDELMDRATIREN